MLGEKFVKNSSALVVLPTDESAQALALQHLKNMAPLAVLGSELGVSKLSSGLADDGFISPVSCKEVCSCARV